MTGKRMKRKASFKNMPKLQAKKFARFRHEQQRRRLKRNGREATGRT